jgi:hypothetical protein
MRAQRKLLRELVTHDGLKDSLTGLLSLPAFLESAKRELHSAERNGANRILYLVSITEINDAGKRAHIVRADREITDRDFLPISCREVLAKFSQLEANLPRDTKVLSANCAMNQLNLSIMKRVDLPFYPSWLDNFQPNVVAFVGGGLQRIRLN